jgi:hypothetical protein
VQADPIRAPARAQDLILRHRVRNYRAGDLERRYSTLEVEEDVLYAYGFLPRRLSRLLHPRSAGRLSPLEQRVLALARSEGTVHPRDLEPHVGSARVVNGWGGQSKAATRALERLHHHGLLRVARRDNGVRCYEPPPAALEAGTLPPGERLRALMCVVADVLAPVAEKTLRAIAARLRRALPNAGDHQDALRALLKAGALERHTVDGVPYLWPPSPAGGTVPPDEGHPPRSVRFLAPFDPVVWDRGRFEHFWQWPYRFEAYTPPAKRVRGYYALPLLWGDAVIGWANAGVVEGTLRVELGFAGKRPRERAFRQELDAEIARLEAFLGLSGR